ncbi:hypothetical protein HDU93_008039 [Gonapodya sp. JEL0774]|nr:hypothetical protein HDU93_008039 [Gonapodya sp. JEL0774]
MCGDGTNDCGALKAAHVGLALSDSEASVVAPFTSANIEITDTMTLFLEGRCALDTSFTAFKFMLLYALVQLVITLSLSHMGSTVSNNQLLVDDLLIVTGLAFWMAYTGPARTLSIEAPADSLFHAAVVTSLVGQVALFIWFFVVVTIMLYSSAESAWFCSLTNASQFLDKSTFKPLDVSRGAANFPCYPIDPVNDVLLGQLQRTMENTVFWLFAHFQFLVAALGVTIVARHRQPFWNNRIFAVYLVLLFLVLTFMLLTPDTAPWAAGLSTAFNLREGVPLSFRLKLWVVAMVDIVVCGIAWELLVVDRLVPWIIAQSVGPKGKKISWLGDRKGSAAPGFSTNRGSFKGSSVTTETESGGIFGWLARTFKGNRLGGRPGVLSGPRNYGVTTSSQIYRRTLRDPVSEDEVALIDRPTTRRTVAEAEAFGESSSSSPELSGDVSSTSPISSPPPQQRPAAPLQPTLKLGGRHLSQRRAERRVASGTTGTSAPSSSTSSSSGGAK